MDSIKSFINCCCKRLCLPGLLACSLYISACQNSEMQKEQLNNNGSGMDQDHTAAPPDTVPLLENQLNDTIQVAGQKATADTVQ